MAHLDIIDLDLLTSVAREIGRFVDDGLADQEASANGRSASAAGAVPPLILGETLTVWRLRQVAFEALGKRIVLGDISEWVEPTDTLYHQIRLRGVTAGFCRSYVESDEETAIFQIEASANPSQLDQLFGMIERNLQEDPVFASDPVVRLLDVPSYETFTLWLFSEARKESRVVIIQAAERYEGFTEGAILDSRQFFGGLIQGGPMLGVI